jgi:hypothetical protein
VPVRHPSTQIQVTHLIVAGPRRTGKTSVCEAALSRVRLLHKHGLTVARAVAAGESPPRRLHPGVRDRVLKLLRDAGILEHEARGRWRVIDPLLRHYLASLDPFG